MVENHHRPLQANSQSSKQITARKNSVRKNSVQKNTVTGQQRAVVGVVMGSRSDWSTMEHCVAVLRELEIPHEYRVVSAHRTPDEMFRYAEEATTKGLKVIIAAAGGAAHLPGMVAAKTLLPVIGVPILSHALRGLDSLLSIVQMPRGVPVATVAVGEPGAVNAALLAAQMLAVSDNALQERLRVRREAAHKEVVDIELPGVLSSAE